MKDHLFFDERGVVHTVAYSVYISNDYSRFKRLEGNRDVLVKRIKKIVDSINKVGYIRNPIIVNDKLEIIDGQGRFEALKSLNKPIEYIIAPGAGIEECISMNINMENWKLPDYINSYAEMGDINYIRLKALMNSAKDMSLHVIWTALFGAYKASNKIIRDGDLSINEEQYNNALKSLNYIKDLWENFPKLTKLNKTMICQSFIMYYRFDEVDKERLMSQFYKYYNLIAEFKTNETSDKELERIYNYRSQHKQLISHLISEEKLKLSTASSYISRKKWKENNLK